MQIFGAQNSEFVLIDQFKHIFWVHNRTIETVLFSTHKYDLAEE